VEDATTLSWSSAAVSEWVLCAGGQHDGSFSLSGSLLCQINVCVY